MTIRRAVRLARPRLAPPRVRRSPPVVAQAGVTNAAGLAAVISRGASPKAGTPRRATKR